MPRTRCVSHPARSRVLIIREDYLDICGGFHCGAALMAVFEYWHNVRLDQCHQERSRAKSNPTYKPNLSLWVYKSVADLSCDLLGLYGSTAIQGALSDLQFRGFIQRRFNPDNPMDRTPMYLFMPEAVQKYMRGLTPRDDDGEPTIPVEPNDAFNENAECNDSKRALSCKEITSTEITSNFDSNENETASETEPLATSADFRRLWEIPMARIKQRERPELLAMFDELPRMTVRELQGRIDEFAISAATRGWRANEDSPARVFVKSLGGRERSKQRTPTTTRRIQPTSYTPPIAPSAPQRDFPAEWNAIVTAAPYEWNGHAPRKLLARYATDEVFCEKWADVCKTVQKIHEVRGLEVSWLTLVWVLSPGKEEKPPGWYRVVSEFKGMATRVNGKGEPIVEIDYNDPKRYELGD